MFSVSNLVHFVHSRCGLAGDGSLLLVYVSEGKAEMRLRNHRIVLESHQVVVLSACHLIELCLLPDCAGYAIGVNHRSLPELDQEELFMTGGHIVVSIEEVFREEVYSLATKMSSLSKAGAGDTHGLMSSILKVFLFYLSVSGRQCIQNISGTRGGEITSRFIKLVSSSPNMQKRVVDYAKELHVSSNYLSRIIKENAGVSPISYVHKHFIILAQKMALESSLSMKEIAYKLGFEDTSHFSKFFKINTGQNFSQFRRTAVHRRELL